MLRTARVPSRRPVLKEEREPLAIPIRRLKFRFRSIILRGMNADVEERFWYRDRGDNSPMENWRVGALTDEVLPFSLLRRISCLWVLS